MMAKKLYDGSLNDFKQRYASSYVLRTVFAHQDVHVKDPRFQLIWNEGTEAHYSIRHDEMLPGEALTLLARQYELMDVGVRETPIEEIIRGIYEKSSRS